jgi:hypothetical protein
MGTLASFRQLRDEGVVTQEQVKAWDEVRNSVMHGSLVSPYSSAEEDQKLLALSKMFHALTRRVLTT